MERPERPSRVAIGRVIRTHGVRGELRVRVTTDVPERFRSVQKLWLVRSGEDIGEFEVRSLRTLGEDYGLKLVGVEVREKAALLCGSDVEVEALPASALPADTYFVFDLIGLTVKTDEGEVLGTVEDVTHYPANDVLTVKAAERSYDIPVIRDVVLGVDLEAGEMTIHLLPGLTDL